jgi:hypothetical protein
LGTLTRHSISEANDNVNILPYPYPPHPRSRPPPRCCFRSNTPTVQLALWTSENFEALKGVRFRILDASGSVASTLSASNGEREKGRGVEVTLPPTAHNRLGDNWRPLFAIAEIAGGDWPQLVADAFTKLTAPGDFIPQSALRIPHSEAPQSALRMTQLNALDCRYSTLDGHGLLAAVRDVFLTSGHQRLFTRDLVTALRSKHAPAARSAKNASPAVSRNSAFPHATSASTTARRKAMTSLIFGTLPASEFPLSRLRHLLIHPLLQRERRRSVLPHPHSFPVCL